MSWHGLLRGSMIAGCLALAGQVPAEDLETARPLVAIDDFTLTTLHLGLFASQTGRTPTQPDAQVQMLNELASHFMLANSDQGRALEREPEILAALEVARARLLAQAFVREQLDRVPVSEEALRARYDEIYAGQSKQEYKASHILLETREEAMETIAGLDAGGDFATLARERSIGPSKSSGGELGWFEADAMVPEFAAATTRLADGAYSREPVKTEFGWHVILRESSRAMPKPDFATARPEIEAALRQEMVTQMIRDIRDKTRITIYRGDGSEVEDGSAD